MEKNVKKTRIMRISTKPPAVQITEDQKQPNDVEYFNYLVSMMTNDAMCTRVIKSRIFMEKVAFNKKFLFTSKLDSNLMRRLVKCYIWSTVLYGAENWTLREADKKKYFGSFEKW
jgi:hypothetical protein